MLSIDNIIYFIFLYFKTSLSYIFIINVFVDLDIKFDNSGPNTLFF